MEVSSGHAVKDDYPSSSKFKWRIDKVSELNQDNHFSPTFTLGPCKWRLLAFRRGSNVDDYLSVYVVADEWTDSRYAKFSLSVVGQANNTFKKDTEGQILQFTKEENDWGFDEFIRFNELTDPSNGYIVNDACIVEVELYSFSKQDSVKELVPMDLMESGHSSTKSPHKKTKKRKELEKDNSSSVQRKRLSIEGGKEKAGEQVIESGEEATQHGKQVTGKWQGAAQRYSKRIRAAAEGVNAAGSGKILDGKRVAENGKENIIDGSPSSKNSNFENQPAKKAKMTIKKKVSKANEGESRVVILISPSMNVKKPFRAAFTPLWSLIKRIYKIEKLSFSKEQLEMIQGSPFGNIFMAFHETRETEGNPCKTHSRSHWSKSADACNKMLKWYVKGPGKNEHYFVFRYKGKEYKLRSTSEQLAVIFGMPQMEGRGKEEHLTKLDKTYSRSKFYVTYFGSSGVIRKVLLENNIVRLVESGEENEDLVKLIGLFMCETLFFTAREASRLNEKYLKLFDSPEKTNSLSWPDLIHDHLMASINEHKDKDTSQVTGCVIYLLIWFAEHIKSGIEKTPIAEGLPRLARWNLHGISSAIETDFLSLTDFEISESFCQAYSEAEKQILNSLRMQLQEQDQLRCVAEQGQPQQNDVVELEVQDEVQTEVQRDEGVTEDTSAKRSQPDTLGVGSSTEDTEDVEIPNVDDALETLDTSITSGDVRLKEMDIVNPAKGDASIPPVECSVNPPDATNVVALLEGHATRVIEESTAPTTPFVNSSILGSEANDGLHSTIGCDPPPPPGLADMESYVREYDNEAAFSSHVKFVEHLHKLYLFHHAESKYLSTRLSGTQCEKVSLEAEVRGLKLNMQGLVTRGEAALAKQVEVTNGVQEKLTSAITRIQELESLNQDKARQHADLQLQLEGVQEQLAVANARIQEVESLNQAQALQHADVQFQLEGDVESLKSQLKRAKEYYSKWAKDQVNQLTKPLT